MKLLFASDIHGSVSAVQKVIAAFEKSQADKLVLLGDLLYHGPRNPLPDNYNPKEVAAILNTYQDKIVAVRGNCDAEVDQMMLTFPCLADYALLLIDGHCFYITHGHLFDKDKLPPLSSGDIFVHGHFHVAMLEKKDEIVVMNPNSCALPKQGVKGYGIYDHHHLYLCDLETDEIISEMTL